MKKARRKIAPSVGMTAKLLPVHDDSQIDAAIAAEAREPGGSLIKWPDHYGAGAGEALRRHDFGFWVACEVVSSAFVPCR